MTLAAKAPTAVAAATVMVVVGGTSSADTMTSLCRLTRRLRRRSKKRKAYVRLGGSDCSCIDDDGFEVTLLRSYIRMCALDGTWK